MVESHISTPINLKKRTSQFILFEDRSSIAEIEQQFQLRDSIIIKDFPAEGWALFLRTVNYIKLEAGIRYGYFLGQYDVAFHKGQTRFLMLKDPKPKCVEFHILNRCPSLKAILDDRAKYLKQYQIYAAKLQTKTMRHEAIVKIRANLSDLNSAQACKAIACQPAQAYAESIITIHQIHADIAYTKAIIITLEKLFHQKGLFITSKAIAHFAIWLASDLKAHSFIKLLEPEITGTFIRNFVMKYLPDVASRYRSGRNNHDTYQLRGLTLSYLQQLPISPLAMKRPAPLPESPLQKMQQYAQDIESKEPREAIH